MTPQQQHNLSALFLLASVLMIVPPFFKQSYVLLMQLKDPDYYPLKSIYTTKAALKNLAVSSMQEPVTGISFCSRDEYSPSLYLLVQIIRLSNSHVRKIVFPSQRICKSLIREPSSIWIYFGKSAPPSIRGPYGD